MTEKKAGALTVRLEVRLTPEEQRMLQELARREYPEYERAQGHIVRRLIREAYSHLT